MKTGTMPQNAAQELGLDVLLWIAGEPARAERFFAASGMSVSDLRDRANEAEFQGFVIEFLIQGDEDLLAFCADQGCKPEDVLAARAALPGGKLPNWT